MSKRYYGIINQKHIIFIVFIVLMALSAETIVYNRALGINANFFETVLTQTNEEHMILFPLMYIFLLLNTDDSSGVKTENYSAVILKDALYKACIFITLFLLANLVYCILVIDIKHIFINVWSSPHKFFYTKFNPLVATSVSLYLFIMRLSFLAYLISFINILTKKSHFGFVGAFIISYIDFKLYDVLFIEYPLGILPIEHTRILYTEAVMPDFYYVATRIPLYVSILYWIGLIAIIYLGFFLLSKKRSKK